MIAALIALSLAVASNSQPTCRAVGLGDAVGRYAGFFERKNYRRAAAFFARDGVMYDYSGNALARGSSEVERVLTTPERLKLATHVMGIPEVTSMPEGWQTRGALVERTVPQGSGAFYGSFVGYEGTYDAIWRCASSGWVIVRMGYGPGGEVVVNTVR